MRQAYIKKKRKEKYRRIFMIPLTVILCITAISFGIFAGNTLFSMDMDIVKNIDTENFKGTLNLSLPIINTVYNSGNISTSLLNEIKDVIGYIFNFQLNSPVTILNSQSPYFNTYYNNILIAQKESISEPELEDTGGSDPDDYSARDDTNDENQYLEGGSGIEYIPDMEGYEGEFLEGIDVAWFHEETEDRDLSKLEVQTSGKIEIQNETKYKIDIEALLKEPLKIKFDKKGPKILIYHTHTTEAYLKNLADLGKKDSPNSSPDPRSNVVRVGNELAQTLQKTYGIEVIHNGTVHDYIYNNSYGNSLNTVTQILKSYPSIKITLDIHRDGLAKDQGKLRRVKEIDGKAVAQVMFVIGTDANGFKHPNWKENLKLALKLQEKLNEICPGLARPILISKNRYNQHLTTGSLIIEIGGDGNTLNEALESTKYVAKAINEVISKLSN
ncbi:MAG TPA: stage II sporulation protein P [Clostridiaceae bacterium]|nr:stage II sporulation protein P [Clostridiaceae bacterium]